jgi:predicted dehydrogenase
MQRREFAGAAAATLAAAGLAKAGDGNKLRVAVVGVNGRGMEHVAALGKLKDANVQLVGLCDCDAAVLGKRTAELAKKGHELFAETDLRKLFARKDVDAVTIATPNHWHSLAAIWAVQAGKDVYVEKPGTHNLVEGRALVAAAKKHGKIVQHGVQMRSSPALRQGVQALRDGLIGDVYLARGLCFRNRPSIGKKAPSPRPESFDWNLWQGPAAARGFSARYVHYNWHWHWEYGNGDLCNQGVHQTDMCLWGLGAAGLPTDIAALGGKFLFDDDKETPEVLSASYGFAGQKKMIEFEVRPWHSNTEGGAGVGNLFYGSKGYAVVNGYSSFEAYAFDGKPAKGTPAPALKLKDGDPLPAHFANWVAAIRARNPELQHGPVETAHTSSALAHLGNASYRLGRRLRFDPATEAVVGDGPEASSQPVTAEWLAEANGLLGRKYRAGFELS